MNKSSYQQSKGFTLIELLIVIVVLGILAAIAYPSYEEQVRRSRRTDAQTALLELATLMEHYYTENNSYTGASTPADVGGPSVSREGFYDLSITNLTGTTYTLNATPVSGGAQDGDSSCATMTLTHTNIKAPASCW